MVSKLEQGGGGAGGGCIIGSGCETQKNVVGKGAGAEARPLCSNAVLPVHRY